MIPQLKGGGVCIRNIAPFSDTITCWLKLNNVKFDDWLPYSRRYESAFLAWEIVRKNRNPFFITGTGFEGYYIGICHSTNQVLDAIMGDCRDILDCIARQYRWEPTILHRMMSTLTGESSDLRTMYIWAAQLGATIAKLRCNLHGNQEADQFRIETYRTLQSLPPMVYHQEGYSIQQSYSIGRAIDKAKTYMDINLIKPSDQDAWLVAWSIGQFGHPLVRTYLEFAYRIASILNEHN